jgi:hypothetical protein
VTSRRADPSPALRVYTSSVDRLVRSIDRQIGKEVGAPPRDAITGRPAAYELFGMGSYGRRELAPYSDLDFGILIGASSAPVRDYFRRYAVRLGELLRAVDPSPHGLRPCDGLSAAGERGAALVDTAAGMAQRLAGRSPDFAELAPRARDYLQAGLSDTRPVLARGRRGLHGEFIRETRRALGPAWPRPVEGSARATLIERLRPSLRDPFGLPDAARDPAWSAGLAAPAPKDPSAAIREGQVNIKHDILRAFQTPVLMLRERYAVQSTDTDSVLRELAERGHLDARFARDLRWAYRTALRLRVRRHLQMETAEDRLGPLGPGDRRALRRMVPLLRELRRSMDALSAGAQKIGAPPPSGKI